MNSRAPHLRLVEGSLGADPSESPEDRAREERIAKLWAAYEKAARAGSMGTSRCVELFDQIRKEVAERSPEQVRRMEKARGLCSR